MIMIPILEKKLFTTKEYNKIIENGGFSPDERIELIKGEIIKMSPIGRRHAACVNRLIELFIFRLGKNITLSSQNPVTLDDNSQPQPDLSLLRRRDDFYESGHPEPSDIFLLIEVADTTIEIDRNIKIPLYAEQGIRETWLIDINTQCVEVYRQPSQQGYQQIQKFYQGEKLTISAFPDSEFTINEILG